MLIGAQRELLRNPLGSIGAKLDTERSPVPLVPSEQELKLRTGEGQPEGADELFSLWEKWRSNNWLLLGSKCFLRKH